MKLATLALGLGLLGATSVHAAPYYVGENLTPSNNIALGFQDTPTKKQAAAGRTSTGNIAAVNLSGAYNTSDSANIRAGLPFYMANKNATGGNSRSALGNVNVGAGWVNSFVSTDKATNYGYTLLADVYLPTSRKDEALVPAFANPTTDFYRYSEASTSVTPRLGLFASQDQFSAKANVGYGYTYIQNSGIATGNDHNRNTFTGQAAASWHAMPSVQANLEYNAIILDTTTAQATGVSKQRYLHGLTPSLSGNYDAVLGSAFVTVPLDGRTRDVTNVAFGANVGYAF